MPVQLTPANACRRIRTPTDDAILTANPIVRIFTLDPIPPRDSGNGPAHRALVTDGWTFTYIRIASTFSGHIGWGFDQLHAGAAVELTDIVRLDVASPESDGWAPGSLPLPSSPVQVNGLAIKYTDADADADEPQRSRARDGRKRWWKDDEGNPGEQRQTSSARGERQRRRGGWEETGTETARRGRREAASSSAGRAVRRGMTRREKAATGTLTGGSQQQHRTSRVRRDDKAGGDGDGDGVTKSTEGSQRRTSRAQGKQRAEKDREWRVIANSDPEEGRGREKCQGSRAWSRWSTGSSAG
ncbi:hypothetical protein C8Q79DRAFT_929919 [Trametes meyenii]|nr:hypothetical protein C8Q79DRAFT_929919 [Trametes meyenii]